MRAILSIVLNQAFLISTALVIAVYASLGSFLVVSDEAMEPTLLAGDVIWARPIFGSYEPSRGDLLLVEVDGARAVLRVIGIPGDRIRSFQHDLFVNGESVVRQEDPHSFDLYRSQVANNAIKLFYREHLPGSQHRVAFIGSAFAKLPLPIDASTATGEILLSSNQLYLMGDGRDQAIDSRHFGPASIDSVKGLATLVLYSHEPERVAAWRTTRFVQRLY